MKASWNENLLCTEGILFGHDAHFKTYMVRAGEERKSQPHAFESIGKHKRESFFKNHREFVCSMVSKG